GPVRWPSPSWVRRVAGSATVVGSFVRVSRRIVVMSNCQTGGLHASLAAMLPDDEVLSTMWLGHEPADLAELLPSADVLVTTATRDEAAALVGRHGSSAQVFVVPSLYFTALHPDLSQFLLVQGGEL